MRPCKAAANDRYKRPLQFGIGLGASNGVLPVPPVTLVAMDADDRNRRRAARADWPVARYRLGDEPSDDLSASTTPTQRIAMMRPLAESAWLVAGRALPTYDRSTAPVRVFRAGSQRLDDDDI